MIHELNALNSLSFNQEVDTNIKWQQLFQTITFSQAIHYSPIVLEAHNRIWFQQYTTCLKSIYHLQASSILSFNQISISRDFAQSVWQPIILVQEVKVENTKGPNDSLSFTQTVSYELVKYNQKDSITFTQEVSLNIEKNEVIEQILDLKHGVSVYKPSKIWSL